MKLEELKTMGSTEHRMYNALFRLVLYGSWGKKNGFSHGDKRPYGELNEEIKRLELSDILELYTEEEIMTCRGFGQKSMNLLKELA